MAPRFVNPFASEAELCQHFVEGVRSQGWLVYPETSGFDLLLVATTQAVGGSIELGDQVGVEAKMRDNIKVLYQASPAERRYHDSSPHFFATLTPRCSPEFRAIARTLGVVTFTCTHNTYRGTTKKVPELRTQLQAYYRFVGADPCWTPGVHIEMDAGTSSPRSITPWKIGAVKLCLRALRFGTVTANDFRELGISSTVFRQKGWIIPAGKAGRMLKYCLDPDALPPHLLYPEVTAALKKSGEY